MALELRLPNITGADTREQLAQIKSFLYQTIEQLNFALGQMEKDSESIVKQITDTSTQTSTPEKAESTFNSIKSLIIKSAEIVTAYGDVIKDQLEGVYMAESDYGDYVRKTRQDVEETSEYVERVFQNVQSISSSLDEIKDTVISVTANIKTGLLYYDDNGAPRHGLEIGEKITEGGVETFNKYARFVSDRLSFYDKSNVEVAYISNQKLYITNVEITGNLKHGGYIIDSSNGLAYKWIGR